MNKTDRLILRALSNIISNINADEECLPEIYTEIQEALNPTKQEKAYEKSLTQ